MECPMFIDYTRECIKKIKYTPQDTFFYCSAERYKDCPFYRIINNLGPFCEYIDSCVMFEYFTLGDFGKLIEVANKYCLSENNKNCNRYQLKLSGNKPPLNLLPDGKYLDGDEKK